MLTFGDGAAPSEARRAIKWKGGHAVFALYTELCVGNRYETFEKTRDCNMRL